MKFTSVNEILLTQGEIRRASGGGFNFILSDSEKFHSSLLEFHFATQNFIKIYRKRLTFMTENLLAKLSMDFAVKLLKTTNTVKGHYFLVNQLERSATSIGANVREAKYAHSKADFISKMQIALKECNETEYWLELFQKSEILIESDVINILLHDCGTIRRVLISSINTAKKKIE